MSDLSAVTALKLSALRRKEILRLTPDKPAVCREAAQLRRAERGSKLGRRLRRKALLGRAGSF